MIRHAGGDYEKTGRGGHTQDIFFWGMSRDGYMLGYKTTNLNIAWKLRLSKKAPLLLWFRSFVGQLYILLPPKISTPSSPSAEVIYMPFKNLTSATSKTQLWNIRKCLPVACQGWLVGDSPQTSGTYVGMFPGVRVGRRDHVSWLFSLGIWRFLLRYKQVGSTMGPHVAFILPWVWGPR